LQKILQFEATHSTILALLFFTHYLIPLILNFISICVIDDRELKITITSHFVAMKRVTAGATLSDLEDEALAEEREQLLAKEARKREKQQQRAAEQAEAAKANQSVGKRPHCLLHK
jgi:hypothetical protein